MTLSKFSTLHSPRALYDFGSRTCEDFSGNGLDLSGTAIFREYQPQCFELAPGSDVQRPSYDPLLALTGDITVQVSGRMYGTPSSHVFASFTSSGETLATNTLWQLGANNSTQLRWIHEYGTTGQDSIFLSTGATEALPAPGSFFTAYAVREGNVIRLGLNGRQHGVVSAALTAAAGGTSSLLRVMFGATSFSLHGLKIVPSALTPSQLVEEHMVVLGDYGLPQTFGRLWVGGTTDTAATIVARMFGPVEDLELTVDDGVTVFSMLQTTDANNVARFNLTGLSANTEYTYSLPSGTTGKFKTHPVVAGNPANFKVAFSGDAVVGSASPVFSTILATNPLMFIHMGDLHYQNIGTNNQGLFHAAFDDVFDSAPQHRLYRSVATSYVWDDHDYGGDNSNGSSASKPAVAAVYRSRVPYYPLVHTTAIYQTWDIGRVRFILTDQRSESSVNSATDNSSKTILGATQKAWFKNLIANSPGMLLVWICPRWFGNANHVDSWNSFSTERAELVDYIKANAHGRVVVLSADQHYIGIDDGSHVDHATGGGEPLPTFQAAPLDKTPSAIGGTWSHGNYNNNGQFGTMEVTDSGGSSIGVSWTGYNASGVVLTNYMFTVGI